MLITVNGNVMVSLYEYFHKSNFYINKSLNLTIINKLSISFRMNCIITWKIKMTLRLKWNENSCSLTCSPASPEPVWLIIAGIIDIRYETVTYSWVKPSLQQKEKNVVNNKCADKYVVRVSFLCTFSANTSFHCKTLQERRKEEAFLCQSVRVGVMFSVCCWMLFWFWNTCEPEQ